MNKCKFVIANIIVFSVLCNFAQKHAVFAQDCGVGNDVDVFFVNGINSQKYDVLETSRALNTAIRKELNITNPACLPPKIAYNKHQTFSHDVLQSMTQKMLDNGIPLEKVFSLYWHIYNGLVAIPDYFWSVFSEKYQPVALDDALSTEDLNNHLLIYREAFKNGKNVVSVAHSQGNFFINKVAGLFTPDENTKFRSVAIATPSSYVYGGGEYTTLDEDLVASSFFIGSLDANIENDVKTCFGFTCHFALESYIQGDNSGPQIVAQAITQILLLVKKAKIAGTVKDYAGNPLSLVTIEVFDRRNDDIIATTETNNRGEYAVVVSSSANYATRATLGDLQSVKTSAVSFGQTLMLDFILGQCQLPSFPTTAYINYPQTGLLSEISLYNNAITTNFNSPGYSRSLHLSQDGTFLYSRRNNGLASIIDTSTNELAFSQLDRVGDILLLLPDKQNKYLYVYQLGAGYARLHSFERVVNGEHIEHVPVGTLSTARHVRAMAISNDGSTLYFTKKDPRADTEERLYAVQNSLNYASTLAPFTGTSNVMSVNVNGEYVFVADVDGVNNNSTLNKFDTSNIEDMRLIQLLDLQGQIRAIDTQTNPDIGYLLLTNLDDDINQTTLIAIDTSLNDLHTEILNNYRISDIATSHASGFAIEPTGNCAYILRSNYALRDGQPSKYGVEVLNLNNGLIEHTIPTNLFSTSIAIGDVGR